LRVLLYPAIKGIRDPPNPTSLRLLKRQSTSTRFPASRRFFCSSSSGQPRSLFSEAGLKIIRKDLGKHD
jgi:hypothetical protein